MTNTDFPKIVWKLRAGADRRFRAGHPWVYSNELSESPKGIASGDAVELRDASGKFLARGYGNPHSLIAFRVLSRKPSMETPLATENLVEALLSASRVRKLSGWGDQSHRLSHGEADALPGLVIDRYRLTDSQVFAVQAHTAGMDRIIPRLLEILEAFVLADNRDRVQADRWPDWSKTAVVLRNDLGVRKLEGLEEEEPRLLKEVPGQNLHQAEILIRSAKEGGKPLRFQADLFKGQKTGFFLDQAGNIELTVKRLAGLRPNASGAPLRILDLCCFIGQWSAQLGKAFKEAGVDVSITLVDASAQALELARKNVEAQGLSCKTLKADVLHGLEALEAGHYDLVISDPPALIKNRKDIPAGTHAYLQLNTQVFRLVRKGGAVVSCSCSALLDDETFEKTLTKAASRNQRQVRWIGRGSQAPDHPMLTEFPEGRYLKCWIGTAD